MGNAKYKWGEKTKMTRASGQCSRAGCEEAIFAATTGASQISAGLLAAPTLETGNHPPIVQEGRSHLD